MSNNLGYSINDLLANISIDLDDEELGIAIIALDTLLGEWQTTSNLQPYVWSPIFDVNISNENPQLINSSSRIRFSPYLHQFGTTTVEFLLWDQSYGIPSKNIYTSSFSFNSSILNIEVFAVNDPPVLFPSILLLNYTESDIHTRLSIFQYSDVRINDVDSTHITSAQIKIVAPQSQFDRIQLNPPNINLINLTQVNSTFIFVSANKPQTILEFESIIQTLTYWNVAEEPSSESRMITITVNDGNSDSDAMLIDITIILTNDAPKVIH
ncbi:hypothetical protein LOD99_7819 [Oopsacas minuta]|uniref:Cadherin domain-containing protein n=1 Tax=Oopsacas minuta TaxID=111878 RepID=A0AAV7JPY6_9METZ|nr:hypothetical protein LOD99_7819 [Oopsacas minuta]